MRFFCIVLCFLALIALIGHALLQGTDLPFVRGAPQIQAQVARSAKTAAASLGTTIPIQLQIHGKTVIVRGPAQSEQQRDQILAAVRAVPLVARVHDGMTVLPLASPFRFRAEKSIDGAISLSGHVPNQATEERLVAAANAAGSGAPITVELELASGVPEGDWPEMVEAGLEALSHLETGVMDISDTDGELTGAATDGASWEASDAALASSQFGTWRTEIAGAPPEDGYLFTAMKAPNGMLLIEGHAPDPDTRSALFAAAKDAAVNDVSGELAIAAGMPEGWPERVVKGLLALGATSNGLLTVTPDTINLSGEVENETDMAVLSAFIGEDWESEILVLDPTPTADVTFALAADGSVQVSGLLPDGMTQAALSAVLPGVIISDLNFEERGRAEDWAPALNGLSIVLPRFSAARARITGQKLALAGNLKRGFSAEGARASLETELDEHWTLDLDIVESAPLAEVILSMRDEEVAISGVLPFGLEPDAALTLLGDKAGGEGLTGGGDGDAKAWRTNLATLSDTLQLFKNATGKIGGKVIEIEGQLTPGYPATVAKARLDAGLADGWTTQFSAEETAPGEGDTRINLSTGERELFRNGYWLPAVDFPVSLLRCKTEIDDALAQKQIVFFTGSAEIDETDGSVLNRLAAVSVRCLNSSEMRLEIGGHTDSVGNDNSNRWLSEQRALAVLAALRDRGVREDAMKAVGYGETRPVATNDTAEGRAQNRRITFEWSEQGG